MIIQLISAIIILALAALIIRSWWHPGIALGLNWCLYAMEQVLQQGSALFLSRSWLLNVLIAGTVAAAVTKNIFSGRFRGLKIPQPLIFALLLLGFAVLSVVWSPDPEGSKSVLLRNGPYMIVLGLMAPLCISRPDEVNRAIRVVLYLGFLICVGLIFSKTGEGRGGIVLAETAQGVVIGNPLVVGSFGGFVSLAAVFTIYRAKTSKAVFVLHLLIAGVAMFALAKSGSRGQMIALVLAAFIWLPITAKVAAKRSSILAIVFSAIIVIGMIYAVTQAGTQNRWGAEKFELATMGRVYQVQYLLGIWAQAGIGHWIFGLGSSASYYYIGFYPHNVMGEVLGEEGLVGLLLLLGFVFVIYRDGYRYIRSASIDKSNRVNLGLLMALFTFVFVLSFKQSSLLTATSFFAFGICIGIFLSALKKQSRRSPVALHPNMLVRGQPFANQANRS